MARPVARSSAASACGRANSRDRRRPPITRPKNQSGETTATPTANRYSLGRRKEQRHAAHQHDHLKIDLRVQKAQRQRHDDRLNMNRADRRRVHDGGPASQRAREGNTSEGRGDDRTAPRSNAGCVRKRSTDRIRTRGRSGNQQEIGEGADHRDAECRVAMDALAQDEGALWPETGTDGGSQHDSLEQRHEVRATVHQLPPSFAQIFQGARRHWRETDHRLAAIGNGRSHEPDARSSRLLSCQTPGAFGS